MRTMPGYYDREGNPFPDVIAWAKKAEGQDGYKRVAESTVDDYWISTVWVGLDMGFSGPPLIFETMVFWQGEGSEPHDLDGEMDRYSTEQQALAGHDQMVARVREVMRSSQ